MDIVTVEQMKRWEADIEKRGITERVLMEYAGKGLAGAVEEEIVPLKGKKVLVAAGKGNNAGDGFVCARFLMKRGASVRIIGLIPASQYRGEARNALGKITGLSRVFFDIADFSPQQIIAEVRGAHCVVDALLGTGFQGAVKEPMKTLIGMINQHSALTVSCDIPSGVNADTGAVSGRGNMAVRADITAAIGKPKRGLFLHPGRKFTGRIVTVPLVVGNDGDGGTSEFMTDTAILRRCLPSRRNADSCKNDFGHLLIIAGSTGFAGAAELVCMGAQATGAGLVTVASARSVYPILAGKLTEAMTLPLKENAAGQVNASAVAQILRLVRERNITGIVAGPGIGVSRSTRAFCAELLRSVGIPIVLDADALNALAREGVWTRAAALPVLTPHPREMARLFRTDTGSVQRSRWRYARTMAKRCGGICVLKGYQTVVTDGVRVWVNPTGHPAMATAGSGDVLAGMIGGFLVQLSKAGRGANSDIALRSALAAVYLHGLAGQQCAAQFGAAGVRASQIAYAVPYVLKNISEYKH